MVLVQGKRHLYLDLLGRRAAPVVSGWSTNAVSGGSQCWRLRASVTDQLSVALAVKYSTSGASPK